MRLLVFGRKARTKVELMAGVNPLKFLQEVRQETAKVTWPTRQETLISTIMGGLLAVSIAGIFWFGEGLAEDVRAGVREVQAGVLIPDHER